MNPIVSAFIKWLIIVGIGVVTFMPTYGLVALNITYFMSYTTLMVAIDCLWCIVLAAILPFSLNIFRWLSFGLFLGLVGCAIFAVWQFLPGIFYMVPWFMWFVVGGFSGVGWLLIATPLRSWLHRTLSVDTQ